jgi:tetratricopeptide (TPR) repeat protein
MINRRFLHAALLLSALALLCQSVNGGETIDLPKGSFRKMQQQANTAIVADKNAAALPQGSVEQQQQIAAGEAARTAIVGIVKDNPNSTTATTYATQVMTKLHDYDRAMPLADHGVDLAQQKGDPKLMTQAYTLRGDVNFGMKNYEAALKDAQAALKIDPKNKAALSLKFESEGRVAGGAGAAAPATGGNGAGSGGGGAPASDAARSGGTGGMSPNSMAPVDPRRAAAVLTETPERQRAEALVRDAAQKMNMDPAAALPLADKAVAADPNDPRAYYTRAAARRATGDLAGAMSDLEKNLALNPNDPSAHAAKASVAVALGRSVDEVKSEFLAAGRNPSEFADYYRDQVAALSGKTATKTTAADGASGAADQSWAAGGGLPKRIRENAGPLILLGFGLVVFGGALMFQTKKRMGDGRRDG